mgnify:CR=1 FL=1
MNAEMNFNYTHTSIDGDWMFSKEYEYGTPWDTILTDFLSFLSGIYGYDIKSKVEFETLEDKVNRLNEHFGDEQDW